VANNVVATLGAAVTIPGATGIVALAGLVAGPWALWQLVLHRRAAHARGEAAHGRSDSADEPDAPDAAAPGPVAHRPLEGSPEPRGEPPAPPALDGSLREPDGR